MRFVSFGAKQVNNLDFTIDQRLAVEDISESLDQRLISYFLQKVSALSVNSGLEQELFKILEV